MSDQPTPEGEHAAARPACQLCEDVHTMMAALFDAATHGPADTEGRWHVLAAVQVFVVQTALATSRGEAIPVLRMIGNAMREAGMATAIEISTEPGTDPSEKKDPWTH